MIRVIHGREEYVEKAATCFFDASKKNKPELWLYKQDRKGSSK